MRTCLSISNVQTAPIQRYSDPRLYGGSLFAPFSTSYQWIRTTRNPLHPECNRATELAIRTIKLVAGIVAAAATAPFALAGRAIQMIHYHTLSRHDRSHPMTQMPRYLGNIFTKMTFLPLKNIPSSFYYNNQEDCKKLSSWEDSLINEYGYQLNYRTFSPAQILRWGHPMKPFCYEDNGIRLKFYDDFIRVFSDPKEIRAESGDMSMKFSVDLLEGEVGRVSEEAFQYLINSNGRMSRGHSENLAWREKISRSFRRNGIRALAVENENRITRWFLFEPTSISITGIV